MTPRGRARRGRNPSPDIERIMDDIVKSVFLVMCFSIVIYAWMSVFWRMDVSSVMSRVQADIAEIRAACFDMAYEPLDDDRPDMIAMLDHWRERTAQDEDLAAFKRQLELEREEDLTRSACVDGRVV